MAYALGPTVLAELLRILMLPDYERAGRIRDSWVEPRSRTFAELLMDCEESSYVRGVILGYCGRRSCATPSHQ
jgi:hypothetical protein